MTPTSDAPVTVEQQDRQLFSRLFGVLPSASPMDQRALRDIAGHRLAALASAPAGDGFGSVEVVRDMDVPKGAWDWIDRIATTLDGPHKRIEQPRDAEVIVLWHDEQPAAIVLNLRDQFNHSIQYRAALDRPRAAVGEDFLTQLRRVNTERYHAWVGDGQDAGILFDAAELGGEVGELLNVVKKLEREDRGWRGSRAAPNDFADECGDVLICLDKLARRKGVELAASTVAKFNATSDKVGLPHRLVLQSPPAKVEG